MRHPTLSTMLGAMAFVGLAGAAQAITVPGFADPFAAGGASVSGEAAAVKVNNTLIPGGVLNFSATGATDYSGGAPSGTPDGDLGYIYPMNADYGTGIAGALQVPVNALVGVFVGPGTPGGTPPAQLDYTSGLDHPSYTPGLDQIFFIGDGLTGTGFGATQDFYVPMDATRLYLGTVDGSGWYNNTGAIEVSVSGSGLGAPIAPVPEPAAWTMMLLGVAAVGAAARRRGRTVLAGG